ncbi:hypothetical protein VQ056_21580 [Paenibacillus sp. JTLBN-2024]
MALVMVASAGYGQKPTSAPESGQQQQETVSSEQQQQTTREAAARDVSEPKNRKNGNGSGSGLRAKNRPRTFLRRQRRFHRKSRRSRRQRNDRRVCTDPLEELDLTTIPEGKSAIRTKPTNTRQLTKRCSRADDADLIPLWGKIELKKLTLKTEQITMDVHMPDEARLGAGGEQFALDALTKTMFQI